jgi:hypothetical protein
MGEWRLNYQLIHRFEIQIIIQSFEIQKNSKKFKKYLIFFQKPLVWIGVPTRTKGGAFCPGW